ncbi:Ribosomal RNA large subunit methyltransferase [Trichinella pseudospiralis]
MRMVSCLWCIVNFWACVQEVRSASDHLRWSSVRVPFHYSTEEEEVGSLRLLCVVNIDCCSGRRICCRKQPV